MPIKFKPSQVTINRANGKRSVAHFYMKNTPLKELIDEYNKETVKPKLRQKIKNELVRRGNVVFVNKPKEE